ncbi:hypothetical protein FB381_2089 [Nocardioides albertanoniae]|uniref:Condensation domain-containing protein n=1 Tax=Nocardioides albertanoniae TaxID=1175486 RepID=A0A543A6P5_9ACTN|nr:hypothetical protein [Nocardioides albertanoniae]TQL68200.1 hypothetical protein FB381_2089 [Nocardioides albertanoniae]
MPEPVMLPSLPPASPGARPAPFSPERTNRLTYDDEVFLRSATVIGVPVVGQTAWRFPSEIPVEAVQEVVDELAKGPLNRLVVRPRVTGARSRWVPVTTAEPVRLHPEPIKADQVMAWLDTTTDQVPFDPVKGPLWAFFMAYTTDGATIVTYNASHIVCDGGMKLGALIAAVRRQPLPRLPFDDPSAAEVTRRDDWRDARTMAKAAARGLSAARKAGPMPVLEAQSSEKRPVPAAQPDDDVVHEVAFAGADCSVAEWNAAVERAGGTSNTLQIAITVEVLLEAGIVRPGEPVKMSLPVSMRGEADLRSNATSGVSIAVETELRDGVGRVTDLAHIRERAKKEFSALFKGTRPDPIANIAPLAQMIPDGIARSVLKNVVTPLGLASNLGRPDPDFIAPFGVPAESIVFRGLALGATRGELRRMRGGVTSWWCDIGEAGPGGATDGGLCNFGIRALDPDAVPDSAHLQDIVTTVYGRWGMTPTFW